MDFEAFRREIEEARKKGLIKTDAKGNTYRPLVPKKKKVYCPPEQQISLAEKLLNTEPGSFESLFILQQIKQ